MLNQRKSWLRPLNDVPAPAARLVCFPHSGGSARSFAPWAATDWPGVQLLAVQYPGRGDRFGEEPATDVRELSYPVANELLGLDPVLCALFGHSLGALVAYETAVMLRDAGAAPQSLMVSGSSPPRYAGGGSTHLADDDELWSIMCGLGGVEPELAADGELAELLVPILRGDITAHETYRPRAHVEPLSCPVRCYHGVDDPLVDEARLPEWARVSTGPFALRRRQGAHFHLFTEADDLVRDVRDALGEGTPLKKNPDRE